MIIQKIKIGKNIKLILFYSFFIIMLFVNSCSKKTANLTLVYEYEIFDAYGMRLFSALNTINITNNNMKFNAENVQKEIRNNAGNIIFTTREDNISILCVEHNQEKYFIDNNKKIYFQSSEIKDDNIIRNYNCGQFEVFFLNIINNEDIEDDLKKMYLAKHQNMFRSVPVDIDFKNTNVLETILNLTCNKYEIIVDDIKRIELWVTSLNNINITKENNSLVELLFSLSGNRLFDLYDKYRHNTSSILSTELIVKMNLLNEKGNIQEQINLLTFDSSAIPPYFYQLEEGLREVSMPLIKDLEIQIKIARMSSKEKQRMKALHRAQERKPSFLNNIIRNESMPTKYFQDHK